MIDENKLIEEIESLRVTVTSIPMNKQLQEYAKHFKDSVIETINEQPKIGWIPVEERLPDKPRFEESYIVQQYNVVQPYTAYWNGEFWIDSWNDKIDGVIAWMPLPEPYGGKIE